MELIVFSKMFRTRSLADLVTLAHDVGFEGYDLCVRPGYPINPDNVGSELAMTVQFLAREGLSVPMLTANTDVLAPDHPTARPMLAAMDKANIRLIKLGYFKFDPQTMDYWAEVERIRGLFAGWEKLAREYHVKVCYHTHSRRCMGLNCGTLAHLLQGFDPEYLGAYVDPGHMNIEGEEFAVGAAIVRPWLSIVALKDSLPLRVDAQAGHGRKASRWLPAGQGTVDWTAVFDELARVGYRGPLSVHCEFDVAQEAFAATFRDEVAFFRGQRDRVSPA